MGPNTMLPVKCVASSFLRAWLEFMTPYTKLSSKESDVAARILEQYLRLREACSDPVMVPELLWSHTSRKDMMDSLGMSRENFQVVLSKLRKRGFLEGENDMIKSQYIPNVRPGERRFMALVVFDWSSPLQPEHTTNG